MNDGYSEVDGSGTLAALVNITHDDVSSAPHQLTNHTGPYAIRSQHTPLTVRRTMQIIPRRGSWGVIVVVVVVVVVIVVVVVVVVVGGEECKVWRNDWWKTH